MTTITADNLTVTMDGGVIAGVDSHARADGVGVLLSGLTDHHIHPVGLAGERSGIDLGPARDLGDMVDLLRRGLGKGLRPVATGLDPETLSEHRLPHRRELDTLGDQPLLVYRVCGHVAVASTALLSLAGIGSGTPDPAGGSLDRDDSGAPTGVLRESAIGLVTAHLPASTRPAPADVVATLRALLRSGHTRLEAMVSVGPHTWCGPGGELDVLVEAAAEVPIDVSCVVITEDAASLRDAARRIESATANVSFGGWKAFADGSLGGRTAALSRPYADAPVSGISRLPAQTDRLVHTAVDLGGRASIHAIGDAATSSVLDSFDRAIGHGVDSSRLRLEHGSVLHPDLVSRLGRSGFAVSVQPAFLNSDEPWLMTRLGSERRQWAYPFRDLRDRGVPLLGGSDAPVELPDPWAAIDAARNRNDGQALTPQDAFALFAGPEPAVGSPADLLLVDRDPVGPDVAGTRVLRVWKAGALVWERPPRK